MPRRNKRATTEALHANVILGDDYRYTRDDEEAERRREARKQRAEAARAQARKSHEEMWTTCVVPGCKFNVPRQLRSGIEFPVCTMHAVAVWMDVEARTDEPSIQQATEALRARRQAIIDQTKAEDEEIEREYRKNFAAGRVAGDIYFIRANGLVKVGWSADVETRLRAYGPNIEILCVYAGTRQDETTLHRQLQPSRAKGREWYHDDDIIRSFAADIVARHGRPMIDVEWKGPRQVVAGKRATRR